MLPDGYTCPLAPGAQAGDLPKGILIVTLIEAVDVPAEDWFSESDVFVQCVYRLCRGLNSGFRLHHVRRVRYIVAPSEGRPHVC